MKKRSVENLVVLKCFIEQPKLHFISDPPPALALVISASQILATFIAHLNQNTDKGSSAWMSNRLEGSTAVRQLRLSDFRVRRRFGVVRYGGLRGECQCLSVCEPRLIPKHLLACSPPSRANGIAQYGSATVAGFLCAFRTSNDGFFQSSQINRHLINCFS